MMGHIRLVLVLVAVAGEVVAGGASIRVDQVLDLLVGNNGVVATGLSAV